MCIRDRATDRLGVVEVPDALLEQVADRLDERAEACRPASEAFVNPAKVLAVALAETVPMVLGEGDLGGVAAMRASSMLARTARVPATYGVLPDAASQAVSYTHLDVYKRQTCERVLRDR